MNKSTDRIRRSLRQVIINANETGDCESVKEQIIDAGFVEAQASSLAQAVESLLAHRVDVDQFWRVVVGTGIPDEQATFIMSGVTRGLADIGYQPK